MIYTFGIDEAGRGPLAWPLVVAIVGSVYPHVLDDISGLRDSKKLSPSAREACFEALFRKESRGEIYIETVVQESTTIDTVGIRESNRQAMGMLLTRWNAHSWRTYIDGADNFVFPEVDTGYMFAKKSRTREQKAPLMHPDRMVEYVIGGDDIIPMISAASIVAKVIRDRIMDSYALIYPEYDFSLHKGYGTQKHRDAILYYGITPIHRKSYAPIKRLISS